MRVAASAIGWFGFVFCFSLLFQVALIVIALGGYCASGGPYEIAVECPDSVIAAAPLSIWGGLLSVGVWLFFAGGFGTPLAAWAWFVLFAGLSIPFGIGGGVSNAVVAILFVGMGAVPLVLELRANAARTLIGSRDVFGTPFTFGDNLRRSIMSLSAPAEGSVAPTLGHWALGLGIPIVASGLGVLAGTAVFGG